MVGMDRAGESRAGANWFEPTRWQPVGTGRAQMEQGDATTT